VTIYRSGIRGEGGAWGYRSGIGGGPKRRAELGGHSLGAKDQAALDGGPSLEAKSPMGAGRGTVWARRVELFLGWAQRAGRNYISRHSLGAKGEAVFKRHPHPAGVGLSSPSDQPLRRLQSLRGFSPVVRDLETSASTIHPLRGFSKPRSYPPPPMGFSPHLSELRKTPSPAGHSRKGLSARPPSSTISSATPSSYLKAAIQAAK
jgi:hypothetical protein